MAASEKENEQEQPALNDSIEPPKDFEAYDREWLKQFQNLSFKKGLYAALASATFFGMFSILTGMALDKVGDPEKKISFRVPQSPLLMSGLTAVGVWFAYLSNVKESLLRKMEEDRLAHRIKAGEEQKEGKNAEQPQSAKENSVPERSQQVSLVPDDKWQRQVLTQRIQNAEGRFV